MIMPILFTYLELLLLVKVNSMAFFKQIFKQILAYPDKIFKSRTYVETHWINIGVFARIMNKYFKSAGSTNWYSEIFWNSVEHDS